MLTQEQRTKAIKNLRRGHRLWREKQAAERIKFPHDHIKQWDQEYTELIECSRKDMETCCNSCRDMLE